MEKEIIKLKGAGDGVRIYLDASSSISEITNSLYDKLRQFRKFFGDGHCNIYFAGRPLTDSDKMRLEAIVKAMLPESTVNYGERRKMEKENIVEQTLELPKDFTEDVKTEDDTPFREIRDVVTTNFKSSRARFYEGVVRGGRTVESDGHLMLVGNVEADGKVAAVGNVIILGKLHGQVEAGCMGNKDAYVIALDMAPSDIRIAGLHSYYDKNNFRGGSKKAYLAEDRIVTEDFTVGSAE